MIGFACIVSGNGELVADIDTFIGTVSESLLEELPLSVVFQMLEVGENGGFSFGCYPLHDYPLVVCLGFALFYSYGTLRATADAGAQAIAEYFSNEPGFAVYYGQSSLRAIGNA